MKKILTVAGSDSGGGAGIQADMRSIIACGGYPTTAITSITAQNTVGVRGIEVLSAKIVGEQIAAVAEDIGIDAMKIGMLPSAEIVEEVAAAIERYSIPNIVLDTVMVATSGDMLVDPEAARHIISRIFPLATVITPNIPESRFITGLDIRSAEAFDEAAELMRALGAKAVLLKSGHLDGEQITDILYNFEAGSKQNYVFPRIKTANTHGTGCSLSSSIATYLAKGEVLEKAVGEAEFFVHEAIAAALPSVGKGSGPINHFYRYGR